MSIKIKKCPDDVNLIDVIEMLVDCVTAAIARKGYMPEPEAFNIDGEILQKAYKNTVEMLGKEFILEHEEI